MSFSQTVRDYAHLAYEHPKKAGLALLNMVPFVGAAVKEGAALVHRHQAHRLLATDRAREGRSLASRASDEQIQASGLFSGSLLTAAGLAVATSWHDQPMGLFMMALSTLGINGSMTAVDLIHLKEKTDALRPLGDARRPDYFIEPTLSSADRSQSR